MPVYGLKTRQATGRPGHFYYAREWFEARREIPFPYVRFLTTEKNVRSLLLWSANSIATGLHLGGVRARRPQMAAHAHLR